jgi:predicted transglutaminase-like cysteine proteinase
MTGSPHLLETSPWFWNKVHDVHAEVNQSIRFENDPPGDDTWGMIKQETHRSLSGMGSMKYGDCDDYAIEKLRRLLYWDYFKRSSMLLTICGVEKNFYHLTLNLTTNRGQVVLDNRQKGVWFLEKMSGYTWIAQEHPGNPRWRLITTEGTQVV